MKDFLGRELKVGDVVAFSHANYTTIAVGRIVKFGKVQVILDCYYGYGPKIITAKENCPSWGKPIQRYPYDVVKVDEV